MAALGSGTRPRMRVRFVVRGQTIFFFGLTVGFIEKNALRKLGARNTVYSHDDLVWTA